MYKKITPATNDIHRSVQDFKVKEPALNAIIQPNLALFELLTEQIKLIETDLYHNTFKQSDDFQRVSGLPGVGKLLAMTILLEIGDINRFAQVGNFASYARCVESKLISNNKTKGKNNRKCGNRYLSWAFHEAAHHALIFYPEVKAFYQRKLRKTNKMIAIRAVAHKLARACFHVLNKHSEFDMKLAFG